MAQSSESLLIQVGAQIPALRDGKKVYLPVTHTFSIAPERVNILRNQGGEITLSLRADIEKFLRDLERPVGTRFERVEEPEEGESEEEGSGWQLVQRNGLKVNKEAVWAAVSEALRDPARNVVRLSASEQIPPNRTLEYFRKRNITHFLGAGQTTYAGSPPNRVKNIRVGASFFEDKLLTGSKFSFNKTIGKISREKGYVSGLVISGDRTEQGLGGGICQVSTTVFRAMYGAGFEILERHPHSYKVYYYDPHGLDAAIYQPSMDLRFTLPSDVWTQVDWNEKDKTITILLFGKKPRYEVQVAAPVTLKTVAPLPDRLIYDRTLPKGTRQQVDWAAEGGTVSVTRIFMQDGKQIKSDQLLSRYRPWGNAFRVGTRR